MTFDLRKDIRQYTKIWLVFFFMVCMALICLPFLPAAIVVHWSGAWQADGWGTKWTLLEILFADAAVFLILKWLFAGMSERYRFGIRLMSDPEGFLYHCWLIISLFLCFQEMLMLAQGFHPAEGGPRFLYFTSFGVVLLLLATWKKNKNKISWIFEGVGFLLMAVPIF